MTEIVIKGNNRHFVHSEEQLSLFLSNGWTLEQEPTPPAEAPAEKKRRTKKNKQ